MNWIPYPGFPNLAGEGLPCDPKSVGVITTLLISIFKAGRFVGSADCYAVVVLADNATIL